jgi:Mn2+/Fe2+ NRAMP family transporter
VATVTGGTVAPHPRRLLRGPGHFKRLGPGIVTGAADDDPSGIGRPLAGELAGLLFAAGIVGTGLLAVPVLAGSTAYAIAEAVGWRQGLGRRIWQARAFYAVIAASILLGMAMDVTGVGPIRALYLAAILNGVAAPPLLLLIVLLARSEAVLGQHRSGLLSQLLVGGAAVVMAVLSLLAVLP